MSLTGIVTGDAKATTGLPSARSRHLSGAVTGFSWTAGAALAISGLAKVATSGREAAQEVALAQLLAERFRPHVEGFWVAAGAVEAITGLGLVAHSRWARVAAPWLSASGVMYASAAAKKVPDLPCGCMGAASTASARESLPRAWVMLSLTVLPLATALRKPAPERRATKSAALGCAVSAAAVLRLSPEASLLRARMRSRKLDRHLREGDRVLRELHASRSWKILRPFVDRDASPTTWAADGNQYVEFPAASTLGDATVGFKVFRVEHELRIRGVVARHDTGQILIKA